MGRVMKGRVVKGEGGERGGGDREGGESGHTTETFICPSFTAKIFKFSLTSIGQNP